MLELGTLRLENPVVLAPMAGVTDPPFRRIVREYHTGLVCGEMVSSMALHYNSRKTRELIQIAGEEHPVSIQIFGADPGIMAEAARVVADCGADIIDINMGCPVPKIVKNGEGAALMRNLPLAAAIIGTVVKSVTLPVTVKFRLGWDKEHFTAAELARIAAENGAVAVTVHGRTREQFYQGEADWESIAAVKRSVAIPVIGNGDIDSPRAAAEIIRQTGCDGVMIGQAALGRPWLFRQVSVYLETGTLVPDPPLAKQFETIRQHLRLQVAYAGEARGIKEMRKHLAWYLKGTPGAARLREKLIALTSLSEVFRELGEYAGSLGVEWPDQQVDVSFQTNTGAGFTVDSWNR
ncbi:MAG TPA: tRNA dihydrouridine synthase DusB [Bacillota bacterium]